MTAGGTSKVVVINRHTIENVHRAKSDGYTDRDGAPNKYSPWVTNEEAMWLKTAARQLAKWVPTSTEYIAQRLKAETTGTHIPQQKTLVDLTTGEILDEQETTK